MYKTAIQLGVGIIVLAILVQPVVFTALTNFLFVGILPGTDIIAPFWAMGLFYIISGLSLILYLAYQPLYIGDMRHQEKVARQLARKKVLKEVATRRSIEDTPATTARYKTSPSSTKA